MRSVEVAPAKCPYCGEEIELVIDLSVEGQTYIEDCQVCCRPMHVSVNVDASGVLSVSLRHENECQGAP